MKARPVFHDGVVHVCADLCPTCVFRPPERPTTPCIEWDKAKTDDGYGIIRRNGKNWRVHRWTWEQAHGPIPPDLIVMHRCDNPPCYRLDHLCLGTHKDNSDDKWNKGRGNAPRGEAAGRARLTEQQAREIISANQAGESGRALARRYDVSPSTVHHLLQGRNWRHLFEKERGSRMRLAPGRLAGMVATATADQSTIVCHSTLYGQAPQELACRGFVDRHPTLPLRLAAALGRIRFVPPP